GDSVNGERLEVEAMGGFVALICGRACPGHPRLPDSATQTKDVDARHKAGHGAYREAEQHPRAKARNQFRSRSGRKGSAEERDGVSAAPLPSRPSRIHSVLRAI